MEVQTGTTWKLWAINRIGIDIEITDIENIENLEATIAKHDPSPLAKGMSKGVGGSAERDIQLGQPRICRDGHI